MRARSVDLDFGKERKGDPVIGAAECSYFGLLTRGRISWNFTKFLIDRRGRAAARYGPSTRPSRMTSNIEDLLQRD